ncbi:transcriptional regulator [Methanocaldococcus indicus]|uniref:transcriptional regulator n=1 Tax=Methanocaldococcus indicus TaxID=213231 RepID=UPI003C6D1B61
MKIFNSEIRVKILATLYGREFCEFSYLKEKLNLTDGNLEHHLKILEKVNYIEIIKIIHKGKLKSIIKITDKGKESFRNYINELLRLSKEGVIK